MFKKVVHYFSQKGLDKHRQATEAKIDEYRSEQKATEKRLKKKTKQFRRQLEAEMEAQQAALDETIEQLTEFCEQAAALKPGLEKLQSYMVASLDIWFKLETANRKIQAHREEQKKFKAEKAHYLAAVEAVKSSVETEQRVAWRQVAQAIPLAELSDHPELQLAQRQVNDWRHQFDEACQVDIQRLESAARAADVRGIQMDKQARELEPARNEVKAKLAQHKITVKVVYDTLLGDYRAIKDGIKGDLPNWDDLIRDQKSIKAVKSELYDEMDRLNKKFARQLEKKKNAMSVEDWDKADRKQAKLDRTEFEKESVYEEIQEYKTKEVRNQELFEQHKLINRLLLAVDPERCTERVRKQLEREYRAAGRRGYNQAIGIDSAWWEAEKARRAEAAAWDE